MLIITTDTVHHPKERRLPPVIDTVCLQMYYADVDVYPTQCLCFLSPPSPISHHRDLFLPPVRKTMTQTKSFACIGPPLWNRLPPPFRSTIRPTLSLSLSLSFSLSLCLCLCLSVSLIIFLGLKWPESAGLHRETQYINIYVQYNT